MPLGRSHTSISKSSYSPYPPLSLALLPLYVTSWSPLYIDHSLVLREAAVGSFPPRLLVLDLCCGAQSVRHEHDTKSQSKKQRDAPHDSVGGADGSLFSSQIRPN